MQAYPPREYLKEPFQASTSFLDWLNHYPHIAEGIKHRPPNISKNFACHLAAINYLECCLEH